MIVDRLENAKAYDSQLPHLKDALKLIESIAQPDKEKHSFEGGYLMYQTGETKPASDGAYEVHREYIDVQILVKGHEYILWNTLGRMTETAPYDIEKDKHAINGEGSLLEMQPGMFAVMFPEDAHKACRHPEWADSAAYEKYVVKLKI